MSRILIVDDEESIRKVIREYGEYEGYEVEEAADGREAVQLCRDRDYDVIIMDVMLPRMDGFSAYKEIRRYKDIPVLILSARGEEYDKLFGFEIGADDYMVKPFSPMELMARIRVILRRNRSEEAETDNPGYFVYEGLEIDSGRRRLTVDGRNVSLAPKDLDLLFYLVKNRNRPLSREALLADVWGYEFFGNDRIVDSHIKMLRNNLGPYRDFIVTHRNMGYCFEAPDK